MTWRLEFYNERRGILARYSIEAALPAEAVRRGRQSLLAEYPPQRAPRRLSLFARAERIGGRDDGGWVLYRIGSDGRSAA